MKANYALKRMKEDIKEIAGRRGLALLKKNFTGNRSLKGTSKQYKDYVMLVKTLDEMGYTAYEMAKLSGKSHQAFFLVLKELDK